MVLGRSTMVLGRSIMVLGRSIMVLGRLTKCDFINELGELGQESKKAPLPWMEKYINFAQIGFVPDFTRQKCVNRHLYCKDIGEFTKE